MDLRSALFGMHTLTDSDGEAPLERKSLALRSAYEALSAGESSLSSFEAFVASVPVSVLGTFFGSDGLDQHYTRLFGGLAVGDDAFDAVLAFTINFLLGQLTYQGRYLAKHEPEALVVAGGGKLLLEAAVANAQKIETFKVGTFDEQDFELRARMDRLALNCRPIVWGDPVLLAKTVTTGLGRPLGCLAFLDVGLPNQSDLPYQEVAEPLSRHFTSDTFHLFAGDVATVFDIRRQLHRQFPIARFIHRGYGLSRNGANVMRSVLVATEIGGLPDIVLPSATRTFRFYPRGSDFAAAERLSGMVVREDEIVPVKRPSAISSSAPLSGAQIATITQPVLVNHRAARLIGGRVIDASTIFAQSYVIATAANQIFEEMHLSDLIGLTPYGKPDENALVQVQAREIAHVAGPALLFSFSPAIVAYHSHFLLQCFPRVITAEHLGVGDIRLLIPSTTRAYQRRMLEMAGYDASRLVVMDPAIDYVCDDLYVPNIPPAIFSPFQATVYDRLIDQVACPGDAPQRRIIISRAARTTWRNMVNFDAMCDVLVRDCGFVIVEPDKLSIEDEIRLFQSSSIVVGAEGAGLYNCCFMAPGTDVIVLADQDYVMYVVGSMAAIRGFDVSFVFGEAFQANRDLSRRAGHTDFVIDPVRVKDVVMEIIDRRSGGACGGAA